MATPAKAELPGARPAPSPTARPSGRISATAAFWFLAAALVMLLTSSAAASPLYEVYQARWHFSAGTLTAVFATYCVVLVGTLVLFGTLSDRLGRRRVIVAAFAVHVLAVLLFLGAHDVGWLFAARAAQGLGTGLATGTMAAALLDLAPTPRLATLATGMGPPLGVGVGAAGAGALAQFAPAPTILTFAALGTVYLVLLVATAVLLPETGARPKVGLRGLVRPAMPSVPRGVRSSFVALAAGVVGGWAVGSLYQSLGPQVAQQVTGIHGGLLGGVLILLMSLAAVVAQLAIQRSRASSSLLSGAVTMLAGLGLLILSTRAGGAGVFVLATLVLGVAFGFCFKGAFQGIATLAAPTQRAGMSSAIYVAAYFFGVLPAVGSGYAEGALGLTVALWLFAAVVAAFAVVAVVGALRLRSAGVA